MAQPQLTYLEEDDLYAIDFSSLLSLVQSGELITEVVSVVSVPEDGITISEEDVEDAGKRIRFRIVPVTIGAYEIQAKVRTNQNNTKVDKVTLTVDEL